MSKHWTDTETTKLKHLLLYNPTADAVAKFMMWQKRHPNRKGHDRKITSVARRAATLRCEAPKLDRLSLRAWSLRYGIPRTRLNRTIKRLPEHLKPKSRSTSDLGISLRQLTAIVKFDPSVIAGCDMDVMRSLFGGWIDDVTITPRKGMTIRNIETGEVFPSAAAASRKYFVCDSAIRIAAKSPRLTAAGFHWERVESSIQVSA